MFHNSEHNAIKGATEKPLVGSNPEDVVVMARNTGHIVWLGTLGICEVMHAEVGE